jgi:hypothetical protein
MPAFGVTCPAIQLRERLRCCCREQMGRQLCPDSWVGRTPKIPKILNKNAVFDFRRRALNAKPQSFTRLGLCAFGNCATAPG